MRERPLSFGEDTQHARTSALTLKIIGVD